MSETPVAAPQPDAEAPAAPSGQSEVERLLKEAWEHLAAGTHPSALAAIIRAVEILAGL